MEEPRRTCFVVSAFGATDDEQRAYKQVLHHLVKKVLEPPYEVIRGDLIHEEGLITNQIIEHLLEDDLVVADLTGLNPNVFYEIAVRHAARKPIVHLITRGQEIPFDVANMRAVQYALDDPDLLEEAQMELRRKVRSIEEGGFKAAPNPISAARDVWLLRESEQPDVRRTGDLLGALNDLRDEVRGLRHRVDDRPSDGRMGTLPLSEVRAALKRNGAMRAASVGQYLSVSTPTARAALQALGRKGEVTRLASGAWTLNSVETDA